MLTTPITTSHFHASVLALMTSYNQAISESEQPQAQPLPLVPALRPVDTPLTPNDTISQVLACTSPWIDLGSPDPLIAHLSRQVFTLEIAYAAFCGVVSVIVPGPRLRTESSVALYARAIKEALSVGAYLQIHIMMPMVGDADTDNEEMGDLARFAREEFTNGCSEEQTADPFGAWDAWNLVRTVCKYHPRLSLGKNNSHPEAIISNLYKTPIFEIFWTHP